MFDRKPTIDELTDTPMHRSIHTAFLLIQPAGRAIKSMAAAAAEEAVAAAAAAGVPDEIYDWAADQVSAGRCLVGQPRPLGVRPRMPTCHRLEYIKSGVPPGEGAGGAPGGLLGERAGCGLL